jgi:cation diffusion facilitator CzcD-associated flavoprotein CzcO
MFHSARWDHSVPLDGRRVAVIGSGSTATQITIGLSPRCAEYKIFGRTPQWVLPAPNPGYSRLSRLLLRTFPALNRRWGRITYWFYQWASEDVLGGSVVKPGWQRTLVSTMCHLHLRRVKDRALRERLRPKDKPACKRLIIASKFYKRFNDGDAQLVDTAIECITERGIRTVDGHEHEVDVIVLATGFYAQNYLQPVELIGPDGLRLSKLWSGDPRAYRTVALPEFPNFFLLLGPHSPVGNQSLFTITENQVAYVMQMIERWRDHEFDAAAPTAEATDRFLQEIREALPNTTWATGCQSWYIGKDGLPVLWPFLPRVHRDMLATPALDEWTFSTASTIDAGAPENAKLTQPQPA